jgi:hypothetical protein
MIPTMQRGVTLKKLLFVVLAFVSSMSFGPRAVTAQEAQAGKVIAYYFHGSVRCPTCRNMEKYSREAIETNFNDALASGKLDFQVLNVEERVNEHFAKEYQLYTKSLILSLVKDGKEVRYKNLDKIWEYVRNKQEFIDYVTAEINGFLKDAQ